MAASLGLPGVLPLPVDVSTWHEFTNWVGTGSSWTGSDDGALPLLGTHLWIWAVSLVATLVIGLPLALGLSRLPRGGLLVTSIANAARAIPIVGVLILLAVGPLGVGNSAAIVALIIFAIPPVLTNTYTGLRSVDPDLTDAASGMGMTPRQVVTRVELPLAIPLIATGVRLAAVQIWATATIAAVVGSGGLGNLITGGYAVNDYGEVYGGVLVIVVTAVLLEVLLLLGQRYLRRRFGQPAEAAPERAKAVLVEQ